MKEKYVPPEYQKNGFTCPHCGAFSEQEWITPYYFAGATGIHGLDISLCRYCDKIKQRKFAYSVWVDGKLVYPISSTAPLASEDMPEEVKSIYNEARTIASLSPSAAAALLRLALQKLVVKLECKGKNLKKDIEKLIKDKKLPEMIAQALDSVRIFGNYAVHPGKAVSPGEIDLKDDIDTVNKLFELINIIVAYTITQREKIAAFYKKTPESKRITIKERDSKKE